MYVDPEGRIVVLTPPRTGSRSVRDWLLAHGWRQLGHHRVDKSIGRYPIRICLVRNHWDCLVSWWCRHQDVTFADFIRRVVAGETVFYDVGPGRTLYGQWLEWATDVARFESLEADLSRLLEVTVKLEHAGRSEPRRGHHYSYFYSWDTAKLVAKHFLGEIEQLGYSLELRASTAGRCRCLACKG